jgi:hypothetical protein
MSHPEPRSQSHLTSAELQMCTAAEAGQLIDYAEGVNATHHRASEHATAVLGSPDIPSMHSWGKRRIVRASILRQLLVGQRGPIHAKGLRLRGARITGILDLEAVAVRSPLALENCFFDSPEPIILDYANLTLLSIVSCYAPGISAVGINAKNIKLNNTTNDGFLLLPNAEIAGNLDCRGAQLTGTGSYGNSIFAQGAKINGRLQIGGCLRA